MDDKKKYTSAKFWVGLVGALVQTALLIWGPEGNVGRALSIAEALLTASFVYIWPNKEITNGS